MNWNLDQSIETSAGTVAAGQTGAGSALVLAHGWPWSSFSWHRIIPELARNYEVFWYDMPGYGRSDKRIDQPTSLDIQGQVFSEMLQYWGLQKPTVIAHDFGGATTLRANLLHGCNYERYVLMNVVAMRPWGSDFFAHVGRHVDAFKGLPEPIHRAVVKAYISGALVSKIDSDDFKELLSPWLSEDGKVSFYRQFEQADERYTAEIETRFGEICCPVKILWGEDDPWIPLERGKALHKLMPNAIFEGMHGVGHLPQLEAPLEVLKRLDGFIRLK